MGRLMEKMKTFMENKNKDFVPVPPNIAVVQPTASVSTADDVEKVVGKQDTTPIVVKQYDMKLQIKEKEMLLDVLDFEGYLIETYGGDSIKSVNIE